MDGARIRHLDQFRLRFSGQNQIWFPGAPTFTTKPELREKCDAGSSAIPLGSLNAIYLATRLGFSYLRQMNGGWIDG